VAGTDGGELVGVVPGERLRPLGPRYVGVDLYFTRPEEDLAFSAEQRLLYPDRLREHFESTAPN